MTNTCFGRSINGCLVKSSPQPIQVIQHRYKLYSSTTIDTSILDQYKATQCAGFYTSDECCRDISKSFDVTC